MSSDQQSGLQARTCTGPQCDAQIIDMMLLRKDGERVRHVFDETPVVGGMYQIAANLMGEMEASHVAGSTTGYVSHFATCANAPQFGGH